MQYKEQILEHKEEMPLKEAIVDVQFSQGDLIEMRNILREFNPNLWAKGFLKDIETTLEKVDVY